MLFDRKNIPSSLTYRYIHDKHKDNNGKDIFVARPRVEIRLSNKDQFFRLAMLVDSGADVSLIPLEIAEILKLELGKAMKSQSASNEFVTKPSKVNAELLKGSKSYDLGLMDIRVPVNKMETGNLNTYALLGRSHFFKKFDITFRENKYKIVLRKPKK